MVLEASEDKTHRGAGIASPSMPWAGASALGPDRPAVRSLPPRVVARPLSGRLPRCSRWATGRPRAGGRLPVPASRSRTGRSRRTPRSAGKEGGANMQLDEVALPLVLAWQLGRTDRARLERVRRAADYLVGRGPRTAGALGEPERLVARHDRGRDRRARVRRRPRRRRGDADAAGATARPPPRLGGQLEGWTVTSTGPLAAEAVLPAHDQGRRTPTVGTVYKSGTGRDRGRPARGGRPELPRARAPGCAGPADDPVIRNTMRRRRPGNWASTPPAGGSIGPGSPATG